MVFGACERAPAYADYNIGAQDLLASKKEAG
jgi:hypothetical protein